MQPAISPSYIDGLFRERDYGGLVWISSLISGSDAAKLQEPDYGLPQPLFLFVESLSWFAQAIRSGAWTYYESTPDTRQKVLLTAYEADGPKGFSQRYAQGMSGWKNPTEMADLDAWIEKTDNENNKWLWELASKNRSLIEALIS